MARNANTRYFNARLTKAEIIAGWCYLPFYLVLLSVLLQHLFRALQIPLDSIVLNIAYFSVNLAAVRAFSALCSIRRAPGRCSSP